MKRILLALLLIALAAGNFYLQAPRVILNVDGKNYTHMANAATDIKVRFIHSVQKTPVEEFYSVNITNDGFILESTRYQSLGVGLPFLPEEGEFRREGEYFVFDNLDREYKAIDYRLGPATELSITINGDEYEIYKMVPVGSLVRLYIARQFDLIQREEE